MCFAPQRRHFFDIWTSKSGPYMVCFVTFSLRNVRRATTACTFSTSQLPKVVRTCWCVLYILTSRCASRHNGVHFFDISTSKSGPYMVCFVHFHFEMCFAPQRRALFRHLNFQKWSDTEVSCTFSIRNVLRATTACTFLTSQLPKVVRTWCVLYIFTLKCASRHNGVHFFDISTAKSGPHLLVCFVHFHFEMCFAPQRRALFRHLNCQKWSAPAGVFCTFWLREVLCATTASTFSTSQPPKVVRTCWCALYILTSKCASRHNGVQFFISHLASWLRTRRFSEPTFGPSGAPNHWKNTVFRDFPTFSRICIFFLLTLSLLLFFLLIFLFSLPLPFSAFHLSILSTLLSSDLSLLFASSLLCFSSVNIVRSLSSKLPSINIIHIVYFQHGSIVLFTDLIQADSQPKSPRGDQRRGQLGGWCVFLTRKPSVMVLLLFKMRISPFWNINK